MSLLPLKDSAKKAFGTVAKGAKRVVSGPSREDYPDMSDEEFAAMAESESQAKSDAFSAITESVMSAAQPKPQAKPKSSNYKMEFEALNPDTSRGSASDYQPYKLLKSAPKKFEAGSRPNLIESQISQTPMPKFVESETEELLTEARRTLRNPLRSAKGLYDTANFSKSLSVGIPSDVVVHEGMSERAVSDFGVFGKGAQNQLGLFSRRKNLQARALGSMGNRG